jgi:hypothetical protein
MNVERRGSALLVLMLACLACASGDDTSAGVMLPALHSASAGSINAFRASLQFEARQVSITFDMSVPAGPGASLTIRMPRFGWLGEAEPYPARHFPELQILINGSPAKMESTFGAFMGTVDITAAIRRAEVDPFAISDTPPFVTAPEGRAADFQSLMRLGAVEKSDDYYLAKWTAQRVVKVALASGPTSLTLMYEPRPSYALISRQRVTSRAYLARYCLSTRDVMNTLGPAARAPMFAVSEASIPVSIDGKPPAEVTVDVRTDPKQAGSLIAFCGAAGKAVVGQVANATARVDRNGVVRIVSLRPVETKR